MRLIENYNIQAVKPADYNPRKISAESFNILCESLSKFGVVQPIILNKEKTIIAGHQRTKAMLQVGITSTPAFISESVISTSDEINFNIIHNDIDEDKINVFIKDISSLPFHSFVKVKSESVTFDVISANTDTHLHNICKFGDYVACVCNESGKVLMFKSYAIACKILGKDFYIYKMYEDESRQFNEFLKVNYGIYDLSKFSEKSFGQFAVQKPRSKDTKSTLYENLVIPNLDASKRYIDFGAGKCVYSFDLKSKGFKFFDYEPFYNSGKGINISVPIRQINTLNSEIKQNGLFDVCVLDSVLNSTTNDNFEKYVLTTCNSLLKKEGVLICNSRNIDTVYKNENHVGLRYTKTYTQYKKPLTEDNRTFQYKNGNITFQKYHSKDTLKELLSEYFNVVEYTPIKSGNMIAFVCKYPKSLNRKQYVESLETEFNMEYPNGFKHNKHKGLVETILRSLETSGRIANSCM